MIRYIYKKQRLWNAYQAVWCFLIFFVNNLFFFYTVLKCCFQHYVRTPPWPLVIILLLILLADMAYAPYVTKNLLNIRWILDFVIWVLLLLSFALPDENVACFLGIPMVIRIYDALYLKEMLFDLVRRSYWMYKISIVAKLVYMMLIYGHVTGCIFYALQMVLINNQTFGPYAQNPLNYYQGQLLAYTPIYMFQDLNRYTYAMYYIFALISTIAFGDIIGKNYIEDIYVMFLIIMSTITISIIIEQLYIIFRRKKTRYSQLLNQVRFLSERLKEYKQIPREFREEIINYLIQANWRYMNEQPDSLQSSPTLKAKLIKQSIIANPGLPMFFQKYMLHKLTLTNLPNGAQLSYNNPQSKQLNCYFIVKGKYWIGYQTRSGKFPGGYQVQGQGMNFGVEESLVGTNNVYSWMCIRTQSFGMIFTLNSTTIREMLDQLSVIESPYDDPIQHFQIAKDTAIFQRKKYKCSICDTYDHTLLTCPQCHLIIKDQDMFSKLKAKQGRKMYRRKQLTSKKIMNICLVSDNRPQVQQDNERFQFILKLKAQIKQLRLQTQEEEKSIEKWHSWSIYQKEQNKQNDLQK